MILHSQQARRLGVFAALAVVVALLGFPLLPALHAAAAHGHAHGCGHDESHEHEDDRHANECVTCEQLAAAKVGGGWPALALAVTGDAVVVDVVAPPGRLAGEPEREPRSSRGPPAGA